VRLLSILSVRIIKCAKVRALFAENKVRFARAEQLWLAVSQYFFVTFTTFWYVVSKNVKSHVFWNLRKNVKYVFWNTVFDNLNSPKTVRNNQTGIHTQHFFQALTSKFVKTQNVINHCFWMSTSAWHPGRYSGRLPPSGGFRGSVGQGAKGSPYLRTVWKKSVRVAIVVVQCFDVGND